MSNPFFESWTTPFGLPPFDQIRTEHFLPAYEAALQAHEAEIDAIRLNAAAPDFPNTIEAMEKAGRALTRVGGTFWNLAGTMSDDALREVERELSPRLARHRSLRRRPSLG